MKTKRQMTEEDIKLKYITPAIEKAGWDIQREVFCEHSFTDGRVIVRGNLTTRGKSKRADYLLNYKPNYPIAVVEARTTRRSGCGYATGA